MNPADWGGGGESSSYQPSPGSTSGELPTGPSLRYQLGCMVLIMMPLIGPLMFVWARGSLHVTPYLNLNGILAAVVLGPLVSLIAAMLLGVVAQSSVLAARGIWHLVRVTYKWILIFAVVAGLLWLICTVLMPWLFAR